MDKKDIRIIIKTALSLFLICAVSAGILALINSVTSPLIAENNEKSAVEARLQVLPEAESFEELSHKDTVYYKGISDGNIIGFVFVTSAQGYGGAVEVMTGIGTDGKITGLSILTINETPGLGMNAKKESFISQFYGKSSLLNVIKSGNADENEILAITSATITSKAVTNAVNEAFTLYEEVKEG